MTARKAVEQELTREVILEAARELFYKKSYQQVSMRQIAKELGYSHGVIYYHFKNKAELFSALVAEGFSLLNKVLEEVIGEKNIEPLQKLDNVFLGFIRFGLTHKSHYEIMFLIKDEEIKDYIQQEPNESYQKFAEVIYQLCGKKVTAQLIWSIFLSLHGFVAHYIYTEQSFADAEIMAKAHVQFMLCGLLGVRGV